MREEHDQNFDPSGPLSRRSLAMWGATGLLAAGMSSLSLGVVSAREAEPGDDRGGHGRDDRGRDDRRRHRRHN
jgi:hypothetical protein